MRLRTRLLMTSASLWAAACSDTTEAATDATSIPDTTIVDTAPPTAEEDVVYGPDSQLEIGPPKGPLGNCDIAAKLEGIPSQEWCRRKTQMDTDCRDGECVEAQPGGLPSEPPTTPPNPGDRAP